MTSKMSTAYSGLSALIQAATSQLGDLGEGGEEINAMEAVTVTMDTSVEGISGSSSSRIIPTTPTLECEYYSSGVSDLDLDGNNTRYSAAAAAAATVTPLLTSISSYQHQHQHQHHHQGITSGIDARISSSSTFPMVLMNLLINPAYEDIVTFLPDGKYFAIRRVDFTDLLLYNNFHLISFNDFLELIIRWGFIRVNGNSINIKADNGNNDNNNSNDNDNNNSSNNKADIYVFRHPHFGMNQPVNMNKIKVRNVDTALLPQTALQKCMREELANTSSSSYSKNDKSVKTTNTNNSKRQLSEDYHHQRSRSSSSSSTNDDKSTMTPILLDPIYLSSNSNENYRDQTAQQLRRRSSLELRGVAQAITASKLQLLHGCGELVKELDHGYNNDSPDDSSAPHHRHHHHRSDQQQEKRQSTTSTNLVDGGVETATQNIVTDAIEALLFDESHTRDTFMRYEKELSVSSLPGVVPISMQLFSENNNNDDGKSSDTSSSSPSNNNDGGSKRKKSLGSCSKKKDHKSSTSSSSSKSKPKRKSNGKGRKKTSSSSSSSKLQSSWEINATCVINSSLEDASRNNNITNADTDTDTGSTPKKLRVVIPPNDNSSTRQQRYVGSMMVVSPARMEAAAALVSQSRYDRTDEEFS
jgi:hypothetical protein